MIYNSRERNWRAVRLTSFKEQHFHTIYTVQLDVASFGCNVPTIYKIHYMYIHSTLFNYEHLMALYVIKILLTQEIFISIACS